MPDATTTCRRGLGYRLAVNVARHIESVYRIVDDEMLVYAGPIEIPVAGSTEVKEGDLVISFNPVRLYTSG
jgi:hypothetical protein